MKKIFKGYMYFLITVIYNFAMLGGTIWAIWIMTQKKGITAFLTGLFGLLCLVMYIIVALVTGTQMQDFLKKEDPEEK